MFSQPLSSTTTHDIIREGHCARHFEGLGVTTLFVISPSILESFGQRFVKIYSKLTTLFLLAFHTNTALRIRFSKYFHIYDGTILPL